MVRVRSAREERSLPAAVTGASVGAASQSNNTIVLGKRGNRSDGAEGSQHTVDTISQDTTLDSALVELALHLESGDIASSGDITNSLASADDEHSHQRQHQRSIKRKLEGLDPDEGGNRRIVDTGTVEVASGSSNDAASQETNNDRGRLHDGRTETLAEDDGNEDAEAETEVLWRTPRQGVWRRNIGAAGKELGGVLLSAETRATGPVLEAGLD